MAFLAAKATGFFELAFGFLGIFFLVMYEGRLGCLLLVGSGGRGLVGWLRLCGDHGLSASVADAAAGAELHRE
jgi:hypothetical protein